MRFVCAFVMWCMLLVGCDCGFVCGGCKPKNSDRFSDYAAGMKDGVEIGSTCFSEATSILLDGGLSSTSRENARNAIKGCAARMMIEATTKWTEKLPDEEK